MNTNRVILGGMAGGVAFFFLGWVIYGMLLMNFMAANTNQSIMKPMEDYTWWALMLGNLASGFLLSVIFNWSNITGMASGARAGAIVGLMICLSMDLTFYSMSTMYSDLTVIAVDVIAGSVMSGISGGVVGLVLDMRKAAVAASA